MHVHECSIVVELGIDILFRAASFDSFGVGLYRLPNEVLLSSSFLEMFIAFFLSVQEYNQPHISHPS